MKGPRETHSWSVDLSHYKPGDILTGDGVDGDPSLEFTSRACSRGISILYWRAEWQGLPPRPKPGYLAPIPSRRTYLWTDGSLIKRLLKGS